MFVTSLNSKGPTLTVKDGVLMALILMESVLKQPLLEGRIYLHSGGVGART